MTQLFINNIKAVLDDNTKILFTHKVSNIEDFSIIGLPASKTITLPRCPTNDELFGYICEINRVVVDDEDELIGISFNQSKKVTYNLMSDSELKSEGIIRIVNITTQGYEIELYDKLIDLLEEFEGNEDENTGYLSNLELVNQDDDVFGMYLTSENIADFDTSFAQPVVNVKDWEATTECFLRSAADESIITHTLPKELTPLSFRCLKPWQFDFAVPVNNVIKSINTHYGSDVITYSSDLNILFDELHITSPLRGERLVVNQTIPEQSNMLDVEFNYTTNSPTSNGIQYQYTNSFFHRNANFKIKLQFSGTIVPLNAGQIQAIGTRYNEDGTYTMYMTTDTITDGEYLGDLVLDIGLVGRSTGTLIERYRTNKTSVKVPLYYNENITFVLDGSDRIEYAILSPTYATVDLNADAYNALRFTDIQDSIMVDYANIQHVLVENAPSNFRLFFFYDPDNGDEATYEDPTFTLKIKGGEIKRTSYDYLRSGDYITGKNIFPKTSIKSLLIGLIKTFNLTIQNVNGALHITSKGYILSSDILPLEVEELNPLNFDFSKLKITSKVPNSKSYEDYKKDTKTDYAQKVINTGYSIKKNVKKVELPYSIPGFLPDISSYGYQTFMSYNNNGFSRNLFGDVTGLEDIVFCYLYQTNEKIYSSDDLYYEGNMISQQGTPTEVNWVLNNTEFYYNPSTSRYYFKEPETSSYVAKIENFYTVSPFKFSDDTVVNSLEIGKPSYNFAGLTDTTYPESVTLYAQYLKGYIEDIYDVNTHILSAKVYIDDTFNIMYIYNHKNNYYIVQELTEYDPTKSGIYPVKLRRVNNINNYIQ